MRISTSELRAIVEILFAHLEEVGYESIEIDEDYYWNIPQESKYNIDKNPEDLDIGHIGDDWNQMQKIVRGESEPVSYALVWLSSVLRAIGEKVVM